MNISSLVVSHNILAPPFLLPTERSVYQSSGMSSGSERTPPPATSNQSHPKLPSVSELLSSTPPLASGPSYSQRASAPGYADPRTAGYRNENPPPAYAIPPPHLVHQALRPAVNHAFDSHAGTNYSSQHGPGERAGLPPMSASSHAGTGPMNFAAHSSSIQPDIRHPYPPLQGPALEDAPTTPLQYDSSSSMSTSERAKVVSRPVRKLIGEQIIHGEGICYVYDDGSYVQKEIDGELVNASWGITKAGKPRKRLAIACKTCRDKKIKCEPAEPKCVQCEKSGSACHFETA